MNEGVERMTAQAICRELARCNGGPGLTADELAERLGHPRAVIRQEMAGLVLRKKVCTIDKTGRYKMGLPPRSLFEVS
jgi:DNA-binding IclR family transcriptional regulator